MTHARTRNLARNLLTDEERARGTPYYRGEKYAADKGQHESAIKRRQAAAHDKAVARRKDAAYVANRAARAEANRISAEEANRERTARRKARNERYRARIQRFVGAITS